MVKQKVVIGFFRRAESKSGLSSGLSLFLHWVLDTHHAFCRCSVKSQVFWIKLGSQIFQNIRCPCSQGRIELLYSPLTLIVESHKRHNRHNIHKKAEDEVICWKDRKIKPQISKGSRHWPLIVWGTWLFNTPLAASSPLGWLLCMWCKDSIHVFCIGRRWSDIHDEEITGMTEHKLAATRALHTTKS